MQLDISLVPVTSTHLAWLSRLIEADDITSILVSPDQVKIIFSSADDVPWAQYLGIDLIMTTGVVVYK